MQAEYLLNIWFIRFNFMSLCKFALEGFKRVQGNFPTIAPTCAMPLVIWLKQACAFVVKRNLPAAQIRTY